MRTVRTLVLATAGVVALIGSAFAADIAVRAPAPLPPPPAPLYNWTGFYAGLNAGFHWGRNCVHTTTTNVFTSPGLGLEGFASAQASLGTGATCPDDNGFIGGGQIGYNWQLTNWVLGFETDLQGASNNNDQDQITAMSSPHLATNFTGTGIITSSKDLKWLGTVRGRLGFLAAPSFLVYGTGGLAYGKVEATTTISEDISFGSPTFGSFSDTRTGWTVGGGVEWLFAPNWSVKAEYLYYDLGQVTWSLPDINQFGLFGPIIPPALLQTASQSTTRFNGNIMRAGINWHF